MLPTRESVLHCPAFWHYRWPSSSTCNKCSNNRVPLIVMAIVAVCFTCFFLLIYSSYISVFTFGNKHFHGIKHKKTSGGGQRYPTDLNDPNLHYGIVVDAGSSGSRVFVYVWPTHDGNPKDLLNIDQVVDKDLQLVVKKVNPGLSSFSDHPEEVGKYIRPLLSYAAQNVPQSKHRETPVYIMATAGMRMIPESAQKKIMDNVRLEVKVNFNFLFADNHVEIISGKQEGVFAWIATNYVLGRFHHEGEHEGIMTAAGESTHRRKKTVGIIDMGGGSVQIAYEIPKSLSSEQLGENKNLIADFNLGCKTSDDDHNYRVYVTTFLGFGANSARDRYEQLIINQTVQSGLAVNSPGEKLPTIVGTSIKAPLTDPCLPLELETDFKLGNKTYYLRGSGDYRACQQKIFPLLNNSKPCTHKSCSMSGVYQPTIDFDASEFYGFSEYFYTMDDILRQAGKYDYGKFMKAAKDYCATRWPVIEAWYKKQLFPKATTSRFKYQCFKSAWIVEVLHRGFKFPQKYKNFKSALLIDGKEVQWTLGALLFRTRYFPLREVQQMEFERSKSSSNTKTLYLNQYIILVCFVLVVVGGVFYLHRLQRIHILSRPMSRVSSSSRLEQLDKAEKSQLLTVHSLT